MVLDSDEIIPPDYIVSALKYFDNFGNCGAVQAKHRASEGTNAFQSLMGMCVLSNGSTVQIVKNFYGANALMGHGMMISRQCYRKTSGFPLVVAEDISFAVDIKNAGYEIIYAPDIECTEEFPVNYVSLKKRQCKWTQGNLESMRKYDGDINKSDMKWFEKLDLKLSHYSLPVVPMLGFMLMLCTIALGFAGYTSIKYSLIVYSIMLLFLCSPLIPDVLVYCKGRKIWLLIPYFIVNIAAYASLSPMMISTIIKGCCGKKASFIVTPKTGKKFSLKEAAVYSWDSVAFAAAMCILAVAACGSVLPVIFVAAGCLAAPAIVMLSNIPAKKPRAQKPQRPVSSDSAEKNALPAANVTVASAPVITRTAGILPAKSAVNTSANIGSAVKTSMTRGRSDSLSPPPVRADERTYMRKRGSFIRTAFLFSQKRLRAELPPVNKRRAAVFFAEQRKKEDGNADDHDDGQDGNDEHRRGIILEDAERHARVLHVPEIRKPRDDRL